MSSSYIKSITPIIEANYNNFTQVEKSIADFFLKNKEKVDFCAKNIAEHLFVSGASLFLSGTQAGKDALPAEYGRK